MSDLLAKKCVPCEGGMLPFDIGEIHKYQKKIEGWSVKKDEKQVYFLEKNFVFKDFTESQNFFNLERFQKMKIIIQIFHSVGDMLKL